MAIYWIVSLSLLASIAQRGSKVSVSLHALELGASALTVGVLAAAYAVFPLLLAVHAGRVSDRFGVRYPLLLGASTMTVGLALPAAKGGLSALFLCAALMGLGHIFFHVSIHNLIGSLGANQARTKNFGTFALGGSLAAFIGPSLAGFAIDHAGFRVTFAVLAAIVAMPIVILLMRRGLIPPRVAYHEEERAKSAFDLLANAGLRRTLIMSGVALTGIELFSFYFPIYGRSIALSPSAIGMILSSYAVAGFIVRVGMHRLANRFSELGVLTGSLFIAAITYLAFPVLNDAVILALAAFALGLGLGSAQPLTIILTYNHAPRGRSGEALGMRLMVNKVTQIGVPLVFGGLGAAAGVTPVFLSTGAFLLASGVLSLKDLRSQARADATQAAALAHFEEESR
jgi:predicted MFS family arabinose efflux permease